MWWAKGGPFACCRGRALGCDLRISRKNQNKDKKIIGIATEVKIRPTCSYDFVLFKVHDWTETDQKVLEELQAETDILKSPKKFFVHEDEYPE